MVMVLHDVVIVLMFYPQLLAGLPGELSLLIAIIHGHCSGHIFISSSVRLPAVTEADLYIKNKALRFSFPSRIILMRGVTRRSLLPQSRPKRTCG